MLLFETTLTLIEMILVIAVIVILASIMIVTTAGYLSKTNSAKTKVESHNLMLASENTFIDSYT